MSSTESSRKFHFIQEIASGGFGSVYLTKVIHADGFSRMVAVKLLHPRWSENEEIASRMRDEARLLGWLRHKNIVDVMDLTLIDGRCAVMMEYLEAVDIKVIINHCIDTQTRLPLRAGLEMCAAVANALDAAYNRPPYTGEKPLRVIHRDIKPSNIMVDDSGVVKVLDFGVARAEFDERESKTEEIAFGSLEYMPPERLFFEPESPASDIYSLGATLYEMLALEKFGKAKLRPKEHEAYFEDRFDVLLDRYPMHQEAEDLLHELLTSMLAFEEPERPTAADAVTRLRSFARRVAEHPLEEWAESVIPDLLRATRAKTDERSPGSLVDKILTEDAKALDQHSIWDENTGASTRAIDLDMLADEMTGTMADDARWKALKQATIDDMAKRGELAPSRPPPPEPDDEPEFEFEPEPVPLPVPKSDKARPPRKPRVAPDLAPAPLQPIIGMRPPKPPRRAPEEEAPTIPNPPTPVAPPTRPASSPATQGPALSTVPPMPPPEPLPSNGPSPLLLTVVAMFFAGGGIALMLMALLLLGAGVLLMSMEQPPPEPVEFVPQPAVEPKPLPEPPAFDATLPHVLFVSGRANTTTFAASCGEVRGTGTDRVGLQGAAFEDCRVSAILDDGSRLTARLEKVEPREYLCFVGDGKECR